MKRTASPTSRLVRSLVVQARELQAEMLARRTECKFSPARDSLAVDLQREVADGEAADVLAQSAVCAAAILAEDWHPIAMEWLSSSLSAWEQWSLDHAKELAAERRYSVLSTQYSVQRVPRSSLSTPHSAFRTPHLYDEFLHRFAPTTRRRHGVFFTPQPIADFIVRQIDAALVADFDLPSGLSSKSEIRNLKSEIVFLDPACGTGVFLLALIDHLHRRLGDDWNDFVPNLLPRLIGIELLPVPAFLAKLNIAAKLASTGYDFREPAKLSIHLGDALSPNPKSEILNPKSTLPVVLGNPPFSSLSPNTNPWIARLVRGDDEVRGYVRAGEERLGERKTWLHDDYVKFIRLAQWHVEEAGCGIVGFVTNRGYLDNATFRLMRRELMRVFSHIRIVDLHGSRKGGDVSPDGQPDENVFGLDQGVAIGLFSRPLIPTRRASEDISTRRASEARPTRRASEATPTRSVSEGVSRVDFAELWGTREEKLQALASWERSPQGALRVGRSAPRSPIEPPSLTRRATIAPSPPHWLFVATATAAHPEYAAAWSLADAMPLNTTAPVTARDHFVVAFTREELELRIAEFRNLSIPDDVIRKRYFTRTRSSRYERGDTRGWKLAAARQAVAADKDWQAKIVRCLYRPFDWRWVFWHPAMIDWPRDEVTRHLMDGQGVRSQESGVSSGDLRTPNPEPRTPLCLLARRQQLPSQPCTYFWISDGLALDGVIRSDNRGSESLFPLWHKWSVRPDRTGTGEEIGLQREANFSFKFLEELEDFVGIPIDPCEAFTYIYALFHSPTYRERYATELRCDFPRILLPGSKTLFEGLAAFGQRLIALHLLREGVGSLCPSSVFHPGTTNSAKDSRPHSFRVGGYDVLRKWLQPKHRSAADPEYRRIEASIEETMELMAKIDTTIAQHGGFPAAFAP